jgi:hypothetical protein
MNINYNYSQKDQMDNYQEINIHKNTDEIIIEKENIINDYYGFNIEIKNKDVNEFKIVEKEISHICKLADEHIRAKEKYNLEKSKFNNIKKQIDELIENKKCLEEIIDKEKTNNINSLFCGLSGFIFNNSNENEIRLKEIITIISELNKQEKELLILKDELEEQVRKKYLRLANAEENAITKINLLLQSGFSIDSLPFSFIKLTQYFDEEDPKSVEFSHKANLNKIKNILSYINETTDFVKKNKEDIIKNFYDKAIDIKEVTFKFKSFSGETHNKGKNPFLITFSVGELESKSEFLKVVYKPRNALIDIAVLELLSEINKEKGELIFPEYKIISYEENGSFWEFINGDTLKETKGFALQENANEEFKIKLLKTITYLDDVFIKINLMDMNEENIIISDKTPNIYPIDLEAFDKNQTLSEFDHIITKIKNEVPEHELIIDNIKKHSDKKEIKELISEFNIKKEKIVKRFVPISTALIESVLFSLGGPLELSLIIKTELKKQNFNLLVDLTDLENFLSEDREQGDVPYFTLVEDIVYYGFPESKRPIAKFKKTSEDVDIDNKTSI